MSTTPRIVAFAGSARAASFNKRVLHIAVDAARAAGAEVTLLDLRDYPLPIYDADIEAARGLPANVRALKRVFAAHDAFLLASPEYNSSFTPLMKNIIDWTSRPQAGETALAVFKGKSAGLVAASTGAQAGLRGLAQLRAVLGNIGVLVIPEQRGVTVNDAAFGPDGALLDEKLHAGVAAVGKRLAEVTALLAARPR